MLGATKIRAKMDTKELIKGATNLSDTLYPNIRPIQNIQTYENRITDLEKYPCYTKQRQIGKQ